MKHLNEIKWDAFDVCNVFSISAGVRLTKNDMRTGNIPFIGATDSNNGITEFVSNINASKDSNVLGVNYNGSVVENFYHPYEAVFSDDVKRLHLLNHEDNRYLLLFMKSVILKQKVKYQYGYKFNGERMKKQKIMLPVDENGQPDYAFMEEYMKSVEERLLMQYKNHYDEPMPNVDVGKGSVETRWKAFLMDEIFVIEATKSGIDRKKLNGTVGDIPYLTRTDKNNAWDSFIGEQPNYEKDKGNVLSVGLDTQTAFYQPIPFYTGQNIQVFSHKQMNKYVAMFVIPLLKRQMQKFNWGGNGATLSRLRRQRIMLPELDGQPDFNYMEKYMRKHEALLLNRYNKAKIRPQ